MKFGKIILVVAAMLAVTVQGTGKDNTSNLDERVAKILGEMTLEEKVGQMTQISLQLVAKGYPNVEEPLTLDSAKLEEAIGKYHVGSILNVGTSAHTLGKWNQIITQIQDVATKKTRLKIPILYGLDSVHGAGYVAGATLFPQNLGMAATWNLNLMKKNGEITALEMRAAGVPWNFSPVLGMGRQPLWPRLWETFGEDPFLTACFGEAYIHGLEGDNGGILSRDKVASCIKHYLGYSLPWTGKDRTPAYIPERQLREYFVPPLAAAVKAGALTAMANSSEINGIPVHSSHYYLTELLRHELGFDGLLVSDWNDIKNLHEREKVAATQKEAVRMAVMAGIDMSMVPLDYSFYHLLLELVKEGAVPESRIDEAVSRILKVKVKLGLFENPYPVSSLKNQFASPEFTKINLQAARESITLLKNENQILPLPKTARVLVTGPTADKLSYLNGGWTITWQGDREKLYPKGKLTILEAVQQKLSNANVQYVPGASINEELDFAAVVAAAQTADVAVVCLGEATYCETPGNIRDLTLPRAQLKLVKTLAATKIPIVLVLVEGRPRLIHEIVDAAQGIVMAYLPGMEGGRAIADVLFGDVNPSGKLPITYPKFPNDFTLYDHKYSEQATPKNQYDPEFPFGFGLSYTTFAYSDLKLDKPVYSMNDTIRVNVTVTNTGNRPGKEVVQLYLSDLYASVTPSVKRLKRFTKLDLRPAETKTVTFFLTAKDLSFIGKNNRPVVEPGEFEIFVGSLKTSFIVKE